jgi:hypothetical protein
MIELLRMNCNYLCFLKLKSLMGSIIGIFFFLPVGFFGGLTVGAILGGGWLSSIVSIIYGKKGGAMVNIAGCIGATFGFLIIFILFVIIGANLGNLTGYGVSKVVKLLKK